jgi:hypothetical protein
MKTAAFNRTARHNRRHSTKADVSHRWEVEDNLVRECGGHPGSARLACDIALQTLKRYDEWMACCPNEWFFGVSQEERDELAHWCKQAENCGSDNGKSERLTEELCMALPPDEAATVALIVARYFSARRRP